MPIRNRYKHGLVEGAQVGRFNQGLMSTFIVYRIGETVIDSGPPNQWAAVRQFLDETAVSQLILTHHHEDHSGNASRIAERYNMLPYAPELGRKKLSTGFRISIPQKIYWGDPIPVETQPLPIEMTIANGMRMTAVHAPGHAKDLHCLYFPDEGWMFTADLFIARRLKFLRADERLDQLIDSIRRVLRYEFDTLLCAHRGVIVEGKRPLADKLNNLLELCHQVQTQYQKGMTVQQITRQLLGSEPLTMKLTGFNFSKRNLVQEALNVPLE